MHLGSNGVLCIGAVAGCQALGQEQSAALVLWCRRALRYAYGLLSRCPAPSAC